MKEVIRTCPNCKRKFVTKIKKKKYCSQVCCVSFTMKKKTKDNDPKYLIWNGLKLKNGCMTKEMVGVNWNNYFRNEILDIHDIFTYEQLELMNKLEILNIAHYERLLIGREFELLIAEGKTYEEAMKILGGKQWTFFGETRCFGELTIKNSYLWYKRVCRKL